MPVTSYLILTNYKTHSKKKSPKPKDNINPPPTRVVTPYKRLGKISDILHLNNKNNQLERRVRPPKDVPLDADGDQKV